MKKAKCLVGLALCGAMMFAGSTSAMAADIADYFDASGYASRYPEVTAVCGNDPAALLEHYLAHGISEGQNGGPISALIDLNQYRQANPDLNAVYGDNWEAYLDHYLTFGAAEGRNSFGSFNADSYAEQHSELASSGTEALFNQWLAENGLTVSAPVSSSAQASGTSYASGDVTITASGDTWTVVWDTSAKLNDMANDPFSYPGWQMNSPSSRGYGVHFQLGGQNYMLEASEDLTQSIIYVWTPEDSFLRENLDFHSSEIWGTGLTRVRNGSNGPVWENAQLVSSTKNGNKMEWVVQFTNGSGFDFSEISDLHGYVFFMMGAA